MLLKFCKTQNNLVRTTKRLATTLIKGGTVVNSDRMFKADVLVNGEKIERIIDPKETSGNHGAS